MFRRRCEEGEPEGQGEFWGKVWWLLPPLPSHSFLQSHPHLTRHPLVTDTSYWTGFKLNGLSLPVLSVLLCQQKPRQYCFPKFP